MAEYIERQKVFDSLPTVTADKKISLYGAVADFMIIVSAIPAADVAPVVRCSQCQHGQFDDLGVMHCHKYHCHKKENDFCSYGEKREDRHE